MMNWLIGIFSFRNKAVKKITQYQKQESMPDFLNTNTRLQLLSQRKKNTRNATRSWACCCLRSTSTWSAWWTASGSCYWFLFDILIVWPFWLFFEVLWLSDPYILPSFFCEFELKERNGAKKWHHQVRLTVVQTKKLNKKIRQCYLEITWGSQSIDCFLAPGMKDMDICEILLDIEGLISSIW